MHKSLPNSNDEPHPYSTVHKIDSKELLDRIFLQEIQTIADECVTGSIPSAYIIERERIVNAMQEQSPLAYHNLYYSDYPHWNGNQVNSLARDNVPSDQVKREIIERVHKQLESTIKQKTTDEEAAKKLVDNAVEQAVDRAIHQVRETLGKTVFLVQRIVLKNNQLMVV